MYCRELQVSLGCVDAARGRSHWKARITHGVPKVQRRKQRQGSTSQFPPYHEQSHENDHGHKGAGDRTDTRDCNGIGLRDAILLSAVGMAVLGGVFCWFYYERPE